MTDETPQFLMTQSDKKHKEAENGTFVDFIHQEIKTISRTRCSSSLKINVPVKHHFNKLAKENVI